MSSKEESSARSPSSTTCESPPTLHVDKETGPELSPSDAHMENTPRENSIASRSDRSKSEKSAKYKSLNKEKSVEAQRRKTNTLSPPAERKSYVEEPESDVSSTIRRKRTEKALVRRITNEMQLTRYDSKCDDQCPGPAVDRHSALITAEGHTKKCVKKEYKIMVFQFVHSALRRALWYLAPAIAKRKILFSHIPLMLVLLSLIGPVVIYRERLTISYPLEWLVARGTSQYPSSGYSNLRVKSTTNTPNFNGSSRTFSASSRQSYSDFAVLLRTRDPSESVIRDVTIDEYSRLRNLVQSIQVAFEKRNLSWSEMCREACTEEFDTIVQLREREKLALMHPETLLASSNRSSGNLTRLFLGLSVGGVETDSDGVISKARAFSLSFKLKDTLREEILTNWETTFRNSMKNEVNASRRAANVDLYRWSFTEFVSTVVGSLGDVFVLLGVSSILLLLICLLLCIRSNGYQSKPVVGLAVGAVLFGCALTGYAVQIAGVASLNAIAFPTFFVLIGVGLLIFFSLESTWAKYSNAACDPIEKFSLIMSWDAPCAVLSTLTVVVSFLVLGTLTSNPLVQCVAFVIAAGVSVLLLFALLFFSVSLYVSGRREAMGLKWYQCCMSGDSHFAPRTMREFSETGAALLHDKLLDSRASLPRAVASAVTNPYTRCPIAFLFAIYLVVAISGCRDLRVDLREEFFVPRSSQSRSYIENYREMFGHYEEYLELLFDEPVDYHDPHIKQEILSLLSWTVQSQYAIRTVSWLKDFERFEKLTIYDINSDTFVPVVNLIFLATSGFEKYHSDIIFDKFQTEIIASKMYIELSDKGAQQRLDVIEGLLSKARAAAIPLTIKAPFAFSIQHDLQVMSTILFAFAILMCCLCGLSLLLYGIPSLTLLVLISNLSVVVGVIGFAVYWKVPINVISLSVAISGIALTTVIVAYFCYHYATAGKQQKSRGERVQYSFQSCLLPITFACFVPLLTYLPLLYVDVPLVSHIFKILFLSSVITYAHFLLFLPSAMGFLTEQVPTFCASVQNVCEECSCLCLELEEHSGSIYYIPTTSRSINTEHIRTFNGHYPPYALHSAPRGMIMPPPPGYLPINGPVLVPDVLPYHRQSTIKSAVERRTSRSRRRNSCSESGSSDGGTPRVPHSPLRSPRHERRRKSAPSRAASLHCRPNNADSIYEEPPSPSLNTGRDRSREVSPTRGERSERAPDRDLTISSKYSFREQRIQRDPAIEMHSNWRQYLLEGSLRQSATSASSPPMICYPSPGYRTQTHQPSRYGTGSEKSPKRY